MFMRKKRPPRASALVFAFARPGTTQGKTTAGVVNATFPAFGLVTPFPPRSVQLMKELPPQDQTEAAATALFVNDPRKRPVLTVGENMFSKRGARARLLPFVSLKLVSEGSVTVLNLPIERLFHHSSRLWPCSVFCLCPPSWAASPWGMSF